MQALNIVRIDPIDRIKPTDPPPEVGFQPRGDQVLIKCTLEDGHLPSRLIIVPENATERVFLDEGVVVAVGPGKLVPSGARAPVDVKRGDRVIFARSVGQVVKLDGEVMLLIPYERLWGVRVE